jgi:hypothetical protein
VCSQFFWSCRNRSVAKLPVHPNCGHLCPGSHPWPSSPSGLISPCNECLGHIPALASLPPLTFLLLGMPASGIPSCILDHVIPLQWLSIN